MKSLKAQLLSALVVMWIGLLALAAWSAFSARETMIEERKDGLRRVVEAANGVVNSYVADVAAGKISKEEAQKNALERIAAMRYDGDNYLFIFDSRPVVLMLPSNKAMIGKNVADRKDSEGKAYYVEMMNVRDAVVQDGTIIRPGSDGQLKVFKTGHLYVNDVSVKGASGADTAEVSISQIKNGWAADPFGGALNDPDDPTNSVAKMIANAPVDLSLMGAVVNPLGKVSVINALGSINVSGTIQALNVGSQSF